MTVPDGYIPGSDVANMSIFGYDPSIYYTGRAPLEAASMGVNLKEDDIAFRCNLITIKFNKDIENSTIVDYSGGHIIQYESQELISFLSSSLENEFKNLVYFYSGVGYRNLMISKLKRGSDLKCIPPHDIIDKKIGDFFPKGSEASFFIKLIKKSYDLLSTHPINLNRIKNGKLPANCIWLWGQGVIPKLKPFFDLYNKKGSVISAVDLLKGLGICSKLDVINVPNTTGFLDTNYDGKVSFALESLKNLDLVFIHIEAPDECGHMGDYIKKVKAVEDIDNFILKPILNYIMNNNNETIRLLFISDHPTPVILKTHTNTPVPFLIYDSKEQLKDNITTFDEYSVIDGYYGTVKGYNLMNILFK